MISKERLQKHLDTLACIGKGADGYYRLAFTAEDWQGRDYIIGEMKKAGLSVRTDSFGNIIARRDGTDTDPAAPAVLYGSHADSVPGGGNYDGITGTICALEVMTSLQEDGFANELPLEQILFMCEESSRFGAATLGSRAMREELTVEDLHRLKDKQGVTLYEVLKGRDLRPDQLASAVYTSPAKAFLEVHIEQGKVLEAKNIPLGLVTGIAAPTRFRVYIDGSADHSGATPMGLRRDGSCFAAEVILAVENIAAQYGVENDFPAVVGTVGIVEITPNVMNVIPGKVTLGIDIRSISAAAKADAAFRVKEVIAEISRRRNIPYRIEPVSDEKPAVLSEAVVKLLEDTAAEILPEAATLRMPSGAGHDAMHWTEYCPTGMIFIPCRDGISHNGAEYAEIDDITDACRLLEAAVKKLSRRDVTL